MSNVEREEAPLERQWKKTVLNMEGDRDIIRDRKQRLCRHAGTTQNVDKRGRQDVEHVRRKRIRP